MKPVVLVVEDNPDNMKLVCWILEGEQYDLEEAEDAERGLEILASPCCSPNPLTKKR